MHGAIHQPVDRVRFLLLAVALWFCCGSTAQAVHCPTLGPPFDYPSARLAEELPNSEQDGWYEVWGVYDRGRIGLFVDKNPIKNGDSSGLVLKINPTTPEDFQQRLKDSLVYLINNSQTGLSLANQPIDSANTIAISPDRARRNGELRKVDLAWELHSQMTMPLAWIAERLRMGGNGDLAWLLQRESKRRHAASADQSLLGA